MYLCESMAERKRKYCVPKTRIIVARNIKPLCESAGLYDMALKEEIDGDNGYE